MSDPTDDADGRLETLVRSLLDAPGIAWYPDLFPRLRENHLRFLADANRTPRREAAVLLTAAGRNGPPDHALVEQLYRERGELPALRALADADTVARATMEWQREIDQLLGDAEERAALCDREGVRYERDPWMKRVKRLRDRLSADYADSPASQKVLIEACRDEMRLALDGEKQQLQERLRKACDDLGRNRDALDENAVREAGECANSARKLIDDDNLIIALRKLGRLQELIGGRAPRAEDGREPRLALPTRRNPLGRVAFHFEDLAAVAKRGAAEVARRGLTDYFPDETALEEAADSAGFLVQHAARRLPDWNRYFAALREWLGLSESRSARRGRRNRVRLLQQFDMPNLEARGAALPGRWLFLTAEAWQGVPFYEDVSGRPRVVAVVRLAVPDADRNRTQLILKYVNQTLRDLTAALPAETEDEQRFRRDGLVLVLLPGETLSGKSPKPSYDQFHKQVQLEKPSWAGRIAYLDDLDLLRLLPAAADDRFRALLELALPRLPDALSQTYQSSDAVRPRMFFGRADELTKLENGAAVVFSGRKMGKSSLLHRLRAQCGPDTDQRAVMVGCSGVASGRSWTVLREIERELERLLDREAPQAVSAAVLPALASIDDPVQALRTAKERFRTFIDDAMRRLEAHKVRRLYVLLDEADNFVRAEREETSGAKDSRSAVSWFLRDLQTSSYNGRLRFIFAGYDQIGSVFRDPGLGHSAFGHWGEQPLRLGPLVEKDAKDLVVKPLTALGMLLSDDLAERILDYTSGHASLIQAFCRKLAERVRENRPAWPLNDVEVEFEDVQAVADDQRASGDQSYRQLLEQTLGLNLDIARAYPLKLVFLALVSPNGLGAGRIFGSGASFSFEDALEQMRLGEDEPAADPLAPNLVLDSLDLLVQLGLLGEVHENTGRAFRFKARHYVNVLRTKNGFQAQLRQAVEEWRQSGRRAIQAEPRLVWTLPDSDLRRLRQTDPRPAVAVALPGAGRDYLADMLTSPFADGSRPLHLAPERPDFAAMSRPRRSSCRTATAPGCWT